MKRKALLCAVMALLGVFVVRCGNPFVRDLTDGIVREKDGDGGGGAPGQVHVVFNSNGGTAERRSPPCGCGPARQ